MLIVFIEFEIVLCITNVLLLSCLCLHFKYNLYMAYKPYMIMLLIAGLVVGCFGQMTFAHHELMQAFSKEGSFLRTHISRTCNF